MPWKLDANNNVVTSNGKPVFQKEGGEEIEFDGDHALLKISELNAESATRRQALKVAEDKLAAIPAEILADTAAAAAALETIKNIDRKKLVDAGEVERIRKEAQDGLQTQLNEVKTTYEGKLSKAQQTIYDLAVGGLYKDSKFVTEKLILPPSIAHQTFSNQLVRDAEGRVVGGFGFERDDSGKVVGYIKGQPILSKTRLGETADFEEALPVLVDAHPDRDRLLRGTGATGTGTPPASLSGRNNGYVISRADAKDPARYRAAQAEAARAGQELQIATN